MEYLEIINDYNVDVTNIYYLILKNQFKFLFNIITSLRCHGNLINARKEICDLIEDVNSIDNDKYFEIQNIIKENIPLLPELIVDNLDELYKCINEMNESIDYIVEQYYNERMLTLYYNGYIRFDGYFHILDLKSIFYIDRSFEFWMTKNIQKNIYQNEIDLIMAEKKFRNDFFSDLRVYLNVNRLNLRTTCYYWCDRQFVEIYDKKGKKSFDVNDHPFKILVSPYFEMREVFICIVINYRFYKKKGYLNIEDIRQKMASVFSKDLTPSITGLSQRGEVTKEEKEYLKLLDEKDGLVNYTIISSEEVSPEIITHIVDQYDQVLIELEQVEDETYLDIYNQVESSQDLIESFIETSLTVTSQSKELVKTGNLIVSIKENESLKKALIRMYTYEMYMLSVISEYHGEINRVSYSFNTGRSISNTSPVITPYRYLSHFYEFKPEEMLMFFDVKIKEFPNLEPMLLSTDMVRDYFIKINKKKRSLKWIDELEDYFINNAIALQNKGIITIKERKKLLLIDHENDQEYGINLLEKLFSRLKESK